MRITFLTQFYSFQDALSLIDAGGAGLTKLIIMTVIYLAVEALGLSLLCGPLRKALSFGNEEKNRAVLPLLILGILFLFPLIGALVPDGPACWFFQKWGNITIGYMIYFFSILLIVRLAEFAVRAVRRLRTHEKQTPSRAYCRSMLILILAAAVALNVCGSITAHDVKTTFYKIPKETLGQDEPLRIVLIGDTHIGVNSTPQLYRDMTDRINEQDPDIVVFAGDIVTSSYGAMREPEVYSEILSRIQAKRGKYVVYGNHDVEEPLLGGFTYIGAENALRHPEMEKFIADCGFTLLRDEVIILPEFNGLCIAGRRDESRPGDGVKVRASLAELMSGTEPSEPVLLLQHEPSDLEELDTYGIDLSVSGHTHDGQIFPGNIFSRIRGPQSYGLKKWGAANVIVTSGVGFYGPPIRVATISEIAVIDVE